MASTQCRNCGSKFRIPDDKAAQVSGKSVKCAKCGDRFVIVLDTNTPQPKADVTVVSTSRNPASEASPLRAKEQPSLTRTATCDHCNEKINEGGGYIFYSGVESDWSVQETGNLFLCLNCTDKICSPAGFAKKVPTSQKFSGVDAYTGKMSVALKDANLVSIVQKCKAHGFTPAQAKAKAHEFALLWWTNRDKAQQDSAAFWKSKKVIEGIQKLIANSVRSEYEAIYCIPSLILFGQDAVDAINPMAKFLAKSLYSDLRVIMSPVVGPFKCLLDMFLQILEPTKSGEFFRVFVSEFVICIKQHAEANDNDKYGSAFMSFDEYLLRLLKYCELNDNLVINELEYLQQLNSKLAQISSGEAKVLPNMWARDLGEKIKLIRTGKNKSKADKFVDRIGDIGWQIVENLKVGQYHKAVKCCDDWLNDSCPTIGHNVFKPSKIVDHIADAFDLSKSKPVAHATEGRTKTDKTSGCFIATAVYESPESHQVETLRNFRDEVLLSYKLGKTFVSWYYRTSPSIAKFLTNHRFIKKFIRFVLLDPIVFIINQFNFLRIRN